MSAVPQNPPNGEGMPGYRFSKSRKSWCFALAILAGIWAGCDTVGEGPNPGKFAWDTAFAAGPIRYPDEALLSRSLVEPGTGPRIRDFFRKCDPGKEVRIGFIGGSITAGAKAIGDGTRYSSRLCRFLGRGFPGTNFVEVNAGIGSTGSRFGCSRVQEDILDQHPDMVVVEFAVNDPDYDSAETAKTFEGLLRRCLRDTDLAVVVFQTVVRNGDSLNQGIQARIARHYGIPVIGYRAAIWPLVAAGSMSWESLSPDNVHPNDFGHLICASVLYGCLRREYSRSDTGADGPIAMPDPLISDLYANAGFFREGDSTITVAETQGWEVSKGENGRTNLFSRRRGDSISLRTGSREVSFLFLRRKDLTAEIVISLDGRIQDTVSNYFPDDFGGGYLATHRVFEDADAGPHVLKITNITGGDFDLRYILFAR
jgi:lysophospholipase L1-like esterase